MAPACASLCPPQCGNLAREGLRILVVGRKVLTEAEYREFEVPPPPRVRQAGEAVIYVCVCLSSTDQVQHSQVVSGEQS